jgi:hypothetical protein
LGEVPDALLVGANHQLGFDARSQKQFEDMVTRDPKDDSAITTLMMVCAEYTFDFDCALSAAQKDVLLHDPKAPDATDAYVTWPRPRFLPARTIQLATG